MSQQRLESRLNYAFNQPILLQQALTHRSHSSPHNERLEFLGDGMLNFSVAALLYEKFPQLREGDLSRLRANLVRQETLATIATSLQLGDVLRLGEGELKSGGFRRPSILADALEAIFGAIYLDGGFAAATTVIRRLYETLVETLDPKVTAKDPKTLLQEHLQAKHFGLPKYHLLKIRGEAHAQEFEVECTVPEMAIRTTGKGSSRRIAEQEAAQAALQQVKT